MNTWPTPLIRTALAKSPHTYATWTMTTGLGWVVVSLFAVALATTMSPDAAAVLTTTLPWVAILGAGGLGQVFIGAMTYLLPVVIGGGPRALRQGMAVLETAWPLRLTVRNAAAVTR